MLVTLYVILSFHCQFEGERVGMRKTDTGDQKVQILVISPGNEMYNMVTKY